MLLLIVVNTSASFLVNFSGALSSASSSASAPFFFQFDNLLNEKLFSLNATNLMNILLTNAQF
jgi:hypothetical protein